MKATLRIVLVLSVIGVAYFAYTRLFITTVILPPIDPTKLACSVVTDIDFAVAVDDNRSSIPGGRAVLAVTPTSQVKTKYLALQHESKLTTSGLALCSGSPEDSSICARINAFTWGYDWIPLKSRSPRDPYCLAPLNSQGGDDEGWAILYFTRGNEIFGLAWGSELDAHWPQASNSNLVKIANNSYPDITSQKPLHTTAGLGIPGKTLYGLDFNAWVNPIGAGGASALQGCFPIPPATRYPARLYFAAPSSEPDRSGMMVWYTEPESRDGGWVWSEPAPLGGAPIPIDEGEVEIDSIAFDQRLNANGERHLLITLVRGGAPWSPTDPNNPDSGEAGGFFIVTVSGDDGKAVFGEPQPLFIELATSDGDMGDVVLLRTVIGPRSRGTCSTDPALYKIREKP